ncbi:hypothetical protein P4B35_18835 [Pontiellaceae bacterium B12227]|nr:hypothetical protein [Pontiellaceae bacterium B12227]
MTHLREIILKLADAKIDFVIGGGVACVLHGVERFTLDLDVSVNLIAENLEQFIAVMNELGLKPRVPVPPESLLDADFRQMIVDEKNALVFTFLDLDDPRKHVDMFLTDDLSYEVMAGSCREIGLDGRVVKIAGISKLLELKESIDPPRDKDQIDIKTLKSLLSDG